MTGNLSLLCNFVEKYLGTVHFGNDQFAPILGYGDLVQGNITIKRVYYVEGLNHNLFSVGQFCDADLEVAFRKSTCFVRDLQGNDLLTVSKAKRSSFKSKTVPSSKGRLNLLHMDLCGPMRVASINGKKYILSKGYRVYNKRTRLIVESIHLRFDEIKEMSETLKLFPSQQELDLLFGPLYDEFFNDGTSRVNKSSSPTDNSAPQDTHPSTNIHPTSEPTVSLTFSEAGVLHCGVNLINGICLNCTYGDGKPVTCCGCEGPLNGGFCSFCSSRAGNSFAYDPNRNSFDDSQNLSDYPPQPQYQTYSCELCGNDAHYGYDCPPQVLFVYNQDPCFNQNFDDFPQTPNLQSINEELVDFINTPYWNRPAFCNNDDDDDDDGEEYTIAITPVLPNEHLSTILETESEELIKSSVENLVQIPSESEDFSDIKSECDVPDCDDSETTIF
ncbi:hypothetical protein Tco_0519936 [Tanacetum coccineum]